MKPLVLCALGMVGVLGCSRQQDNVTQLLPSLTGTYQAVVLDCRKNESEWATLLKVVRTNEPATCETKPVQEVAFTLGARPRLAWLSDDTLVIEERKDTPTRSAQQGEVSFLFANWRPDVASQRPREVTLARLREELSAPQQPSQLALKTSVPPMASACTLKGLTLPKDFTVLAGGGYQGKPTTVQIDQSGDVATTMIVSVDNPGKPVVLLLGAYEPTIWSIRRASNTQLLGVLISGYHKQVVSGLEPSVPVAIHTYDNQSSCGHVYVDARHLEELNPVSQRFFGRDVDMVYPAQQGELTVGESQGVPSAWVGGGDITPESFADKAAPLAGEAGLDDAVRKGLLRRANAQDKEQWNEEMARLMKTRRPQAQGERSPSTRFSRMDNAYVVLAPMTLPAGLYGSRLAVFFVPKGTQRPLGKPGHSSIYDFNDMSCTGPGADCDR